MARSARRSPVWPVSRTRPLSPRCNGRTAIAVLFSDRSGLADLRFCRLARHAPDLAGNRHLRAVLRNPPIPDLEFHQSVDRRYRRFTDLHGVSDRVSEVLATSGALDLAGIAPARRFGCDDAAAARSRQGTHDAEGLVVAD